MLYEEYIEEESKKKRRGRPSSWRHSYVKSIKIPEVLIPQVMEYARRLDEEVWKEHTSRMVRY